MIQLEDYFDDKYIIKTVEKLHDNYKLIIHTYDTKLLSQKNTWEYTQGILYEGERLIGSIKRNYSHFPYTFFKKSNRTYFISGSSYMCQTIIDCETGQVYDNANTSDGFCWATYYPIDENTLCVLGCYWGGPCEYRFFDMTDPSKGWPQLKIDKSLRRYCYVLFNNDVGNMKNYSYPIIEGDNVIFTMKETRIKDGDIDMEYYQEYKYQDYYLKDTPEKIVKIEDSKSKIYYVPRSRLVLRREGATMKLVEFWRSEQQIEDDKEEDEDFDREIANKNKYKTSDKYKNYMKLLLDRFPKLEYKYRKIYSNTKCDIYVSKDNKTYKITFTLDDDLISIEHFNWKNNKDDMKVSNSDLNNLIDLIKF
jgi:hypothetical protein